MTSKIVSCEDIEFARESVFESINSKLKKKFYVDDFKVDDAKEVIKEAYIAESEPKYIFLSAYSFNVYAQNSLLKLLEEPPRNIIFIIIVRTKSVLLPTIRSRLQLEILKRDKKEFDLGLDLKYMDFNDIFNFLKEHKFEKRDDLKRLVSSIISKALRDLKIDFLQSELDMFDKLLVLSDLNSRSQNILAYLLLLIYRKRNGKKIKQ
jgi:DNA polymerase-3 subunit delta'